MNSSGQEELRHKNIALWATVVIEGLVIIVIGAYNIYEIRRSSNLVQSKIQGLAEYSEHQGEKVDRMMTALELYVGNKLSAEAQTATNSATTDQRIEKAIEFLEAWKKKNGEIQPDGPQNSASPSL